MTHSKGVDTRSDTNRGLHPSSGAYAYIMRTQKEWNVCVASLSYISLLNKYVIIIIVSPVQINIHTGYCDLVVVSER